MLTIAKETTTTVGTSDDIMLGGAVAGYRTFLEVLGDGNACAYWVVGDGQWEERQGVYHAATNSLTRGWLNASSTGAAVDFAAGTKNVFNEQPTNILSDLAAEGGGPGGGSSSGTLGLVQISDGAGGFSSDAAVSVDSGAVLATTFKMATHPGQYFSDDGLHFGDSTPDEWGYIYGSEGTLGVNGPGGSSGIACYSDGSGEFIGAAGNIFLAATGETSFPGAVIFANMTTTQRDALTPAKGWTIYNSTDDKLQCCTNATGPVWTNLF